MAWSNGGSLGTNTEKTSDSSLTLTTTQALNAGEVGVVIIGIDNIGTTDGDLSEISSVTDAAGNTWTKVNEYTNSEGAAGSGITVSLWVTVATSTLSSGGVITVTISGNTTAKAVAGWKFAFAAGSTISEASSTQQTTDAADAGGITISGLTNQEYLWLHAICIEAPTAAAGYAVDADYAEIAGIGTTGSGAATNISLYGGYRIFTGTGDTVDVTTAARDSVQVYVALQEILASAGGNPWYYYSQQ